MIALRDRGFPVEYILAPDEGHGFQRPVNNMAMFMAAEKFLAKHLDGRYQEGGTPEVVKRLAEITVDPKTVTLAKKVDAAAVGAPKPAVDLKPATQQYQVDGRDGAAADEDVADHDHQRGERRLVGRRHHGDADGHRRPTPRRSKRAR